MNEEWLKERLSSIESRLSTINYELGKLYGAQRTTAMLVKFVILPLIFIVGALVGIKLWG